MRGLERQHRRGVPQDRPASAPRATPSRSVIGRETRRASCSAPSACTTRSSAAPASPGVATGLAVTGAGRRDPLRRGAGHARDRGGSIVTGQLGDVMRESAQAAVSYVRAHGAEHRARACPRTTSRRHDLHLHMPAGAVPKDGPSAGVTLATALVSALSRRPVERGRGDDRRDHAHRSGAPDRRGQGEGAGRPPRRHRHRGGAPAQRGPARRTCPRTSGPKMRIVLAERLAEVLEVALRGRSASPARRACLIPPAATAEMGRRFGSGGEQPSPVGPVFTPGERGPRPPHLKGFGSMVDHAEPDVPGRGSGRTAGGTWPGGRRPPPARELDRRGAGAGGRGGPDDRQGLGVREAHESPRRGGRRLADPRAPRRGGVDRGVRGGVPRHGRPRRQDQPRAGA